MPLKFAILAAGLMGAAGVIVSALAAHSAPGTGLDSAGHMLLFHAASLLAATSLEDRAVVWKPALNAALVGWIAGATLFATAIAMHAYTGNRLFPMAAPIGGSILIASWIALAASAVVGRKK